MIVGHVDDNDVYVNHFNALYPDLQDDNQSKYYSVTVSEFNNSFGHGHSNFGLMHLNVRSL